METEMILRPMTMAERIYSYTQSQQLIMQTGCIGHLRADFGSDNKHFHSNWDDHRSDLKSEDFKHEFEEVINALRGDDKYGAVFKNRGALLSLCITVIPLRSSLPDKCFSYLESTGEMIVITKGEKGYTPTGIYPQDTSPKEGVAAVNEANGVTRAQEASMVAGSMFGWQVPGADPKNYDDQGQPIRPKAKGREHER